MSGLFGRSNAFVRHAIPPDVGGLTSCDSHLEAQMLGGNPSFPPIEAWQKMSEREQDALIQS